MTRDDITHLAQVCVSLHALLPDDEFDRFLDRMLWAIHSSNDNPKFDEQRFRNHARSTGMQVFDR